MESSMNAQSPKPFYLLAGLAAVLFVCLIVFDIAASILAGKAPTPGSLSSTEVFALFQSNPFRGFQYLGFLNVIEQMLMLTVVYAFYLSHRQLHKNGSTFVLLLFVTGLAIYLANNVSLPLYSLSQKYGSAGVADKPLLAAAGESLLSRGEDFTLGSLPGFFVNEVSTFVMLVLMFKARIFSRVSALLGLVGALLLTIFTFGATLQPPLYNTLMGASMFGGLLMLVWFVMVILRLFKMARKESVR
jgi:hypothetical protein